MTWSMPMTEWEIILQRLHVLFVSNSYFYTWRPAAFPHVFKFRHPMKHRTATESTQHRFRFRRIEAFSMFFSHFSQGFTIFPFELFFSFPFFFSIFLQKITLSRRYCWSGKKAIRRHTILFRGGTAWLLLTIFLFWRRSRLKTGSNKIADA